MAGTPLYPHGSRPEGITPDMVKSLAQTKPWVRFMSILMFLAIGFMVLAAFFFLIGGAAGMSRMGLRGAPMLLASVLYVLIAVLYVAPAIFLWRYASAIADMARQQTAGMEAALRAQRSFWRYVGILSIVVLVFYAVFVAIAVVVAVAARMRM